MIDARNVRFGSTDCIVVDGGTNPSIAVIMCHGYGASGSDLAGLSAEWIDRIGEQSAAFRFVFPEAPHTLEELGMPEAHAWWQINMARLMEQVQAKRFHELHVEQPPGIAEATDQICETINHIVGDLPGDATPLALGGFSQGAMLTMNASLQGNITPPKLLFQFSGTVVCQRQWTAKLSRLKDTQVYQSHGTIDPLLPYASAQALHDLLLGGEVHADFHSFVGQHTIDGQAIEESAKLLASLATSTTP